MTDVRAITPSCCGLSRPSCEIVSSVRPSARYSLLGSPVRFSNGRTASMILLDLGGPGGRRCRQEIYPAPTKMTADISTRAAFHQCVFSCGGTLAEIGRAHV